MQKLIEPVLWAIVLVAIFVGSFKMGERVERKWWRSELAAKSLAVRTIMDKADTEATDLDRSLVAALGETDAALAAAERRLATTTRLPAQPADPGDRCRPIPADCLRD